MSTCDYLPREFRSGAECVGSAMQLELVFTTPSGAGYIRLDSEPLAVEGDLFGVRGGSCTTVSKISDSYTKGTFRYFLYAKWPVCTLRRSSTTYFYF